MKQENIEKLTLQDVENGFCRVYYLEASKNRLLCYQECGGGSFELLECNVYRGYREPSHTLPHDSYVERTPLPLGQSSTERNLRKWLVNQTTSDINRSIYRYLKEHGGQTTEYDMSINDLSCKLIEHINRIYGKCYLIKLNLHGKEGGRRDAICKEYQTGENYNAFNFCACFASPMITDEAIDKILLRDTSKYQGMEKDRAVVDSIFSQLEELGAQVLHWA